jgi:integrase
MTYEFCSLFADRIREMLKYLTDFKKDTDDITLRFGNFDRFCLNQFPEVSTLTKELVFAWCDDAKKNGGSKRASVIRRFGEYLNSIGEEAYVVPPTFFPKDKAPPPYILSDNELNRFFVASDKYPKSSNSPLLEFIIPVIFRLQYACGLRPQEVRLLRRHDFNFSNNTVYIFDSKHHKDRRIVVSADIMKMCIKYDQIAELYMPKRTWFFQAPSGNAYTHFWLTDTFHKCWDLSENESGYGICVPYDLRHNYATQILMKWVEEKRNLDALIPYLSTYMGHETFSYTFYYVQLLPERLSKMDFTNANHIIPEVSIYEKYN